MQTTNLRAVPNSGVLIDTEHNNYILNVQNAATLGKLTTVFPGCFTRPYQNGSLVVLPVHEATIHIFHNMGISTSGLEPLRWQYDLPLVEGQFHAMAHQVSSAAFMAEHPRCFNTSTMRTGKTAATILCTDYLQTVRKVPGAVLIVATVSNLTGVWRYTIEKTLPHKTAVVVHGGTGKAAREQALATPADYYIINYDGVKMVQATLEQMVADGRIGIVVVDELTHYGNHKSQRFVAMNAIINGKHPVKYAYGLTGSPGVNPLPVFGFVKLINPERLPCKYLSSWQALTMYHWGREAWQWSNKTDCADTIFKTMQPCIRYDKKDIMDLPPIVRQLRDCDLSAEQRKVYNKMKQDMIAYTESGEVINATQKSALAHKLLQIAIGTTFGSDRKLPIQLDNRNRLNTILEAIHEATTKVVIFCAYTACIDSLAKALRKEKLTVEIVDGRVTGKKRDTIFDDFQKAENPKVLICHPRTTAFGVELSAADTMIFDGPPLSGEFVYEQALERMSSLKQTASQLSIIQIAATAEERRMFQDLDNGVQSGAVVNNLFAELTKNKNSL